MRTIIIYLSLCILFILSVFSATLIFIIYLPSDFWQSQKLNFKGFLSGCPEFIREKLPFFDQHGLRHNLEFLEKISLKDMAQWSLEKQALFADEVTIDTINGGEFDYYFNSDAYVFQIDNLNATSIGNLAYAILHHRDAEIKILAQIAMNRIKDHYSISQND